MGKKEPLEIKTKSGLTLDTDKILHANVVSEFFKLSFTSNNSCEIDYVPLILVDLHFT